jgi:hypothetical protein
MEAEKLCDPYTMSKILHSIVTNKRGQKDILIHKKGEKDTANRSLKEIQQFFFTFM